MRFGAPGFLPLLAIPAGLLILWAWQLWKRRADTRAFTRRRQVPVNERVPFFGELLFWLCLIFAAGSALMAIAKPQAVTSLVRTAGVDHLASAGPESVTRLIHRICVASSGSASPSPLCVSPMTVASTTPKNTVSTSPMFDESR